jgi:hypothetical protein
MDSLILPEYSNISESQNYSFKSDIMQFIITGWSWFPVQKPVKSDSALFSLPMKVLFDVKKIKADDSD